MKTLIDFDWRFHKGSVVNGEQLSHDDTGWQTIDLPHDYSIEGPHDSRLTTSCGFFPKGIGWYRKELDIPREMSEKRIYIEFEGVFRNCIVWLNGELVGQHKQGYTGFFCDLTANVRFGERNVLAVKIDNPTNVESYTECSEGWWYEGCGIYRHVWLHVLSPVHVDHWGTYITTPVVSEHFARVTIRTTFANELSREVKCDIETKCIDADGTVLRVLRAERLLPAESKLDIEQECGIYNPNLWSPDSPYMYRMIVSVRKESEVCDEHETFFGVRWFEFKPNEGFFLNGNHFQLRGMCNHQDFGGLGMALPDRAIEKTLEVMKRMGCNMYRSAHNDPSPALADYCDRMGLLLWPEHRYAACERSESLSALSDMIKRNRNHPSIFCWSLINSAGSPDGKVTETLKEHCDLVKKLEPTRPTAVALEANDDANANGLAFVPDIVGYNGGGMGIDLRDHKLFPERKILISEYSAGRGARGVYVGRPADGDIVPMGDGRLVKMTGTHYTEYDNCLQHEKEWTYIADKQYLAGGSMWSGIEYYGETNGWPTITSQFGVLDICRYPKDAYYYYLQEWTSDPMIHIFPHWNWYGREGEMIRVWCYTNCESSELFLNGESLGTKKSVQHSHICWDVPYSPGILSVNGYCAGKVVATHEIRTSGVAVALNTVADRNYIKADRTDLSFVTVSVLDSTGCIVPDANSDINVSVSGSGRLIGLSSGCPTCHENVKGNIMRAFNGLLLAIVQSNGEYGPISIFAESNGLQSGQIVLNADESEKYELKPERELTLTRG